MSVPSLYQKIVLEHSRAPRRFGDLDRRTHEADGTNPLCGDVLHVELCLAETRIVGYAFRGESCAIARASASMLGDLLDNADIAAVDMVESALRRLIGGQTEHDDALGELNALAALAHYPSRRKCALLPIATVRAALAGNDSATTENRESGIVPG